MSFIKLNISNSDVIMTKLENAANELIIDNSEIDTGKMSSEMTEELCRIYDLLCNTLCAYSELLLYDKERIKQAHNNLLEVDTSLANKISIK